MGETSAWKDKPVAEAFIHGRRGGIPCAAEQLDVMLHLLRHNGTPLKTFIDLGAGDGILSELILQAFPDASGYAIDFSEPMLDAAKKRLGGYAGRMHILHADLADPSWQDAVFTTPAGKADAIVSGYCIHHLPDARKYGLYEEIYGRLNPNGLFINIEHVASRSDWGEMLSDEAFIDSIHAHEAGMENARTKEKVRHDFLHREDKKENLLVFAETQCQWLRAIGFENVDVFFKCYELAVFAGKKP